MGMAKTKNSFKLKIIHKSLAELAEHEDNPRVHPPKGTLEWESLRASLDHDYFDPLVFNRRNGKLVSGAYRWKVLTELGVKSADMVEVDYDEETHRARMVAANSLAGHDDKVKLAAILQGLGEDIDLAGMTEESIRLFLEKQTVQAPEDFQTVDENIAIQHQCPKCHYRWSGKPA